MRKLILLTISVFLSLALSAQDIAQSSLTSFNLYRENSAFGGFTRKTSLFANVRSQWAGVPGNPSYNYIGAHSPVYLWNGAVGSDFEYTSYAGWTKSTFRASYNYVMPTSLGLFSIGGRAGVNSIRFDQEDFITPDGEYIDGGINHNDPVLSNLDNDISLSYEASALLQTSYFQTGISLKNFAQPLPSFSNSSLNEFQLSGFYKQKFTVSYNLDFTAFILLKSDFVDVQSEISVVSRINGNVFGGIGLRGYSSSSLDALLLTFGHQINDRFTIIYNYDAGISEIKRVNQGSHELLLRIDFDKLFGTGLPPIKIYNPRYL